MKNIILSAVALFAFGWASAQSADTMKFGVKGGANFTNFTGDFDNADGRTGFYVGALVDFALADNFHLQPEVLYSAEGAKDAKLDYIRIPVMFKYYIMEGLNLQAGPEVAFKVAAENDLFDAATKSVDFGLGIGGGYDLTNGLFFDIRYNLGLSNISENDTIDFKNTGLQAGLGFRF